MGITTNHHHNYRAPPYDPRPAKRRRLSPQLWPTSQNVLTILEVHTLLLAAGIPAHLLQTAHIDTARLTPAQLQIPKGTSALEWVLKQLSAVDALPRDLDTLPADLLELLTPPCATPLPALLTATPQHVPIDTLNLPIPISSRVWTLKLPRRPTPAQTAAAIQRLLPNEPLLFRGTDRRTRGFFTPVLPAIASTEFGPGLYTTPCLAYACHLAGVRDGVVYVFRVPSADGLRVLQARGREWEVIVRSGGKRLGWRTDVVVGGVSAGGGVDAEIVQSVWRSGEACRRLAEGCVAVFFIEETKEEEE